jgi:hypothetical protein
VQAFEQKEVDGRGKEVSSADLPDVGEVRVL